MCSYELFLHRGILVTFVLSVCWRWGTRSTLPLMSLLRHLDGLNFSPQSGEWLTSSMQMWQHIKNAVCQLLLVECILFNYFSICQSCGYETNQKHQQQTKSPILYLNVYFITLLIPIFNSSRRRKSIWVFWQVIIIFLMTIMSLEWWIWWWSSRISGECYCKTFIYSAISTH